MFTSLLLLQLPLDAILVASKGRRSRGQDSAGVRRSLSLQTTRGANRVPPTCSINLYRAAKRRLDKSSMFPPRLITVQSYLLMVRCSLPASRALLTFLGSTQVQLQLGLARYQTAWLSFAQAARLAQLLGLHRCSPSPASPAEEIKRRCFWSAFQMDRWVNLVSSLAEQRADPSRFAAISPSFSAFPFSSTRPTSLSPTSWYHHSTALATEELMLEHSLAPSLASSQSFARSLLQALR